MKKSWIILAGIVLFVLSIFLWVKSIFNQMITLREGVNEKWSQVENVYQRRSDLIPNLVATVKGYAKHEKETLEGVIQARAKASSISINPENLNAEDLKKFQGAQGELSQALG